MTDAKGKILLVEDDRNISDFLVASLTSSGYHVVLAENGRKAISMTADTQFDVILLDLGLPDIDGMKILKSIREWSDVPILIVSARIEEAEKVEALDAGADDYIAKPFGNNELLARMRAAMRVHQKIHQRETQENDSFKSGDFQIDYAKRRAAKLGKEIRLTPIEYKIVVLLAQNAGKVLTHDFILRRVWGEDHLSDGQLLRVNMANIRRKLEDNPADPQYILTEVGVGYRMVESEE
ncbi:MAG: response regulator transcription factor [Oscillospiraceae bacterium]|nr:response regulator transcription factor [Oscillospiraceae bacterium]